MEKTNIVTFKNPIENEVQDVLTQFLKNSAQKMLTAAIEIEMNEFIEKYKELQTEENKKRIVRNGHLPSRKIQTGIGEIQVSIPRSRDRSTDGSIRFESNLIPKYMKRTASIDVLLPLLYLKGISLQEIESTLVPLLGNNAENLSASTISRLKSVWYEEYTNWKKRDLSHKKYVYWWVDGIYLSARMENEKSCVLVIIGADEYGKKELITLDDGLRESKENWRSLLLDLKDRGLCDGANLAVGDGAMGFWSAVSEIYPETKQQRCWVHKTANILNQCPKSLQPKAKSMIHDIYLAPTKKEAQEAWGRFTQSFEAKYPKAVACLEKNEEELLEFYNFPAEHWVHIRTTNPIESTFATVRHRTKRSKNCFSRETILASVFKLCREAEKRWNPLRGKNRIPQVLDFQKFIDGVKENEIDPLKKNTINDAA